MTVGVGLRQVSGFGWLVVVGWATNRSPLRLRVCGGEGGLRFLSSLRLRSE